MNIHRRDESVAKAHSGSCVTRVVTVDQTSGLINYTGSYVYIILEYCDNCISYTNIDMTSLSSNIKDSPGQLLHNILQLHRSVQCRLLVYSSMHRLEHRFVPSDSVSAKQLSMLTPNTQNNTESYLFDVNRTGGAGGLSSSSDMLYPLLFLCCQSILRCCVSMPLIEPAFRQRARPCILIYVLRASFFSTFTFSCTISSWKGPSGPPTPPRRR